MRSVRPALWILGLLLTSPLQALTFTVTNTSDSGAGSLRDAINQANTNPGLDNIHFNIVGAGPHTISPLSVLPALTQPTIIDGYMQPGSSVNTDPIVTNAVLRIEIEGSNLPPLAFGLQFSGGSSTIRGLVINRFGVGISITGVGNNIVRGNFLGTDPTGTIRRANGSSLQINDSGGTIVGGTAPADRNLIGGSSNGSGNSGISILSQSGTIQGNLIGTDKTGTVAMSNGFGVISAGFSGAGVVIGGAASGERNVISGNENAGIWISQNPSNAVIKGNFIGTAADGITPLGNGEGVLFDTGGAQSILGGTLPGEANVIAYNTSRGVEISGSGGSNNAIRGNSIHSNASMGIDHENDHVPEFNDPLDADVGPNTRQNFPILKTITHLAPQGTGGTRIQGKLHSTASTQFTLDFFSNPGCSNFPREFVEGQTYLGSSVVNTDAGGNAVIDVTFGIITPPNARITATATNPAGNTSEFSQRILFSLNPTSGPSAGGTTIIAAGTDFADPTTITFGAVPATAVTFFNDHQLSITSPALPPGTSHDLIATTPDGTSGILVKGWVSDFLDVPGGHGFYSFVTRLVSNAITAGVGGGNYGVDMPTLREQMAVFLLLSKNGLCFVPPNCTGVFLDVPCSSVYARWIEGIAAAGVTSGCGGNNYCPSAPVTREQMAVFLLRMLEGETYLPPACVTPTFGDVPCSSGFARWIEELVRRGITAGCGAGNYCPTLDVSRGQMAVFLTVTFELAP